MLPTSKPVDLSLFTVAELEGALQFYDCDKLRGSYTGFIAELRRELKRRQAIVDAYCLAEAAQEARDRGDL